MKILVPVDFSKNSLNALTFACNLAFEKNASVALLHVFSAPLVSEATASGSIITQMIADQNEISAKRLEQMADQVKEENKRFEKLYFSYRVILGFAADVILEYADENEMDLIVMGIRGETSAIDRILGSVAGKVINRAKIPVLGVPEDITYHSIRCIGYATDYSDRDIKLLKRVINLFGEMVNYEMIHINTDNPIIEPTKDNPYGDDNMLRFKKELDKEGMPHIKLRLEHYPNLVGGMEQVVRKDHIDLIVMLHRKRGIFGFLRGSDSNEAAFKLHKPVLVFHER